MAKYINPIIVAQAKNSLQWYKENYPENQMPLFECGKDKDENTRAALVRAAQQLKWAVVHVPL